MSDIPKRNKGLLYRVDQILGLWGNLSDAGTIKAQNLRDKIAVEDIEDRAKWSISDQEVEKAKENVEKVDKIVNILLHRNS